MEAKTILEKSAMLDTLTQSEFEDFKTSFKSKLTTQQKIVVMIRMVDRMKYGSEFDKLAHSVMNDNLNIKHEVMEKYNGSDHLREAEKQLKETCTF